MNQILRRMANSAEGAPNKAGRAFVFADFKKLLTTTWNKDMDIYNSQNVLVSLCLAEFLVWSFSSKTILLGALRSRQYDRFRLGGTAGIKMMRGNRDNQPHKQADEGKVRPIAVSSWRRVKVRNAADPTAVDQEFELTIVCTCIEEHEPIEIAFNTRGIYVKTFHGNVSLPETEN